MHPITAETPFTRLWPQRPRPRPGRPRPAAQPPKPRQAPALPAHDFLIVNTRPDLLTEPAAD